MISPQKKGTLTVADNGTAYLTNKGDPLMDTGIYARKDVSPQFAAGYEKGLSDAAKREYWSMQDNQRWVHFTTVDLARFNSMADRLDGAFRKYLTESQSQMKKIPSKPLHAF
jgi:hypothetical protein